MSKSRLLAGLLVLAASAPAAAQEPEDLKAGFHAVLMRGDLLDIPALSKALGLELYLPPANASGEFFRATVTRIPPSVYANGAEYELQIDRKRQETIIRLELQPRSCAGLREWAQDWKLNVEPGLLTDGAGFTSTVRGGDANGVTLSATYLSGGSCSYTLRQRFRRVVEPRFTKSPPSIAAADAGFDKKVAEIVRHGDLRDYAWTAKVLHADFIWKPSELLDDRIYVGWAKLAQVIPGLRADGLNYSANDSGWIDFPSFGYEGKVLAVRSASLSLGLETRQVCIPPKSIPASLERAGIPYRSFEDYRSSRYEVEGQNRIALHVFASQEAGRSCLDTVSLEQTTDAGNSIHSPVEFTERSALEADHLSAAALHLLDLIDQRLQVKIVKRIRLSSTPQIEEPARTRLMDLLHRALIDRGVNPELIQSTQITPSTWTEKLEAGVQLEVLVR